MALPPGLLPDAAEARPSRAPLLMGAAVLAALAGLVVLLRQNRRLGVELEQVRAEVAEARARPAQATPAAPAPEPPAVRDAAPSPAAPPAPAPTAPLPPSPGVRVLPEDPEYLTRGLHDFRRGLYDQAERQFFRALPDSFLYLALTSLAQHNWREAFAFLSRAMGADSTWLRRVNPRDLFGKEGDYDALLQALDEQVSHAPTDPDLKVLSAYLRFHEKGAPYAKALLVEATNASPGHEAAKAFLEALGP